MQKSRLYELVEALTVAERRRAVKFLAGPYGNARPEAAALFGALLRCRRQGRIPERRVLHAALFPDRPYVDSWFRLLQSHLYRCLEHFLVCEQALQDTNVRHPLLLRAFREHQLSRHLTRALRRPPEPPYEQAENYLSRYQVEHERYGLLAQAGRTRELNLQESENALDDAYVVAKLRQACITRSHESVFRTRYQLRFLPQLLAYADESTHLALRMYAACYRALFADESELHFRQFRDLLFAEGERFPPLELRSLYVSALNFCVRRINENKKGYLREALDLYRNGLANEALLEQGRLSRFAFNNIVGIALRLDELSFAESFVTTYADRLRAPFREATTAFNSARIAYAHRQYERALVYLRDVHHSDLINEMTARILQAKIYYDTGEGDLLDHHLRATRRFLRRQKRVAYHHENWTNVLRYFRKLYELNPHDEMECAELIDAVRAESILTEKSWLLQRIGAGRLGDHAL